MNYIVQIYHKKLKIRSFCVAFRYNRCCSTIAKSLQLDHQSISLTFLTILRNKVYERIVKMDICHPLQFIGAIVLLERHEHTFQ